jgi:hypothetical protein
MVPVKKYLRIIKPSVGIRNCFSKKSNLETQGLFGERIEILDERKNWVYCRLLDDNYLGWTKKDGLGFLKKPTHIISSLRSFIFP